MMNAVSRVGAVTLPDAGVAAPARKAYVDVFRGLLIAHMALHHSSLMFNAGRGAEELASSAPAAPADIFQFLTRFTGVPVAPGFFFMAGFMVALTSIARAGRGVTDAEITRRLIVRGLVLLAVDKSISAQYASRVIGMDKASISRCFKSMQAKGLITMALDLCTALNSDHYKTIVLTTMLKKQELTDDGFKKLVSEGSRTESDHYATQVLTAALQVPNLSNARILAVLNSAANINSDFYMTEVLTKAAPKVKNDAVLMEAYRAAAKKINWHFEG